MRFSGRDGVARALYVAVKDRRVVVVRAFVKNTRPRREWREIELALRRAEEVIVMSTLAELHERLSRDPE